MTLNVPAADSKRLAALFWTLYANRNPKANVWGDLSEKQRDDIRESLITAIADFMGESQMAVDKFSENCTEAKKAIVAHSVTLGFVQNAYSRGGKSVRGSITCPICKTGQLHYTRSSYNGHVHANCSTPRCVAWRE
jgi:UDP-glucose 6-dehydrogenase